MKKRWILLLPVVLIVILVGCSVDISNDDKPSVTEEDVIEMVLEKVKGATKEDIYSIEKEFDDGHEVYEGTLFYDGLEYEFEVDASSGQLIEWDIDD